MAAFLKTDQMLDGENTDMVSKHPVDSIDVDCAVAAVESRHNNVLFLGIAIAVMILMGVSVYLTSYNFDMWYMLATGREIVESGIPYSNPFSQLDGAQIIVQQWLLCVILYWIHSIFGVAGMAAFTTIVCAATIFSAYRLGRLKKGSADVGGEIIACLCVLLLAVIDQFLQIGSSSLSMLIFVWIVYFCEKYRRSGRYIWLALLLPLALIHVQLHMAFVIFDLAIIFAYLIPDIPTYIYRRRKNGAHAGFAFARSEYRRIPLLVAFVAFAIVLCMNPYGVRGALYFFLSYDAASYMNDIPEMDPFSISRLAGSAFAVVSMLLLSYMAIAKRGLKSIDFPLTLLVVITSVMAFQHQRNCWIMALFGFMLICGSIEGWSWSFGRIGEFFTGKSSSHEPFSSHMATVVQIVVSVILCLIALAYTLFTIATNLALQMNEAEIRDPYATKGIADTILEESSGEDIKVFNPVRIGGYLEWRGIDPYVDSRIEIWNSPISGLEGDDYFDYVDMMHGLWSLGEYERFLAENDFDYMITESGSTIENYLENQTQDYIRLKGTGNYNLWKKALSTD